MIDKGEQLTIFDDLEKQAIHFDKIVNLTKNDFRIKDRNGIFETFILSEKLVLIKKISHYKGQQEVKKPIKYVFIESSKTTIPIYTIPEERTHYLIRNFNSNCLYIVDELEIAKDLWDNELYQDNVFLITSGGGLYPINSTVLYGNSFQIENFVDLDFEKRESEKND